MSGETDSPPRPVKLGVIGGSGLYDIEGLTDTEWRTVASPFGEPSDAVLCGKLDGLDVAFLPRHGRGHVLSPSTINFRANIDALKRLGVTDIISLSAVGSLQEDLEPGDFVIVDQFIDRTFAREKSFFGTGFVAMSVWPTLSADGLATGSRTPGLPKRASASNAAAPIW